MKPLLTIAWFTLHEARRRRTVVAALVFGLIFLVLYGIGLAFILDRVPATGLRTTEVQIGLSIGLLGGFYVVHFLAVMLTIFSSAGILAGEISSHTIQSIVTKPIRRYEVILGKWLGQAIMLALYLLFLGGGVLTIMYVQAQFLPARAIAALLLLVVESLVLVSLALLGGTRLSTPANGVVIFLLYGIAFMGGWVRQIGTLFQADAAIALGAITGLLLPVEALWRRAALLLSPPLPLPATPFSGGAAPGAEIVPYAFVYGAVVLTLAAWSFGRRDL